MFDIADLRGGDVGQRFPYRQTSGGSEVQQRDRRTFADCHRFTVVAVEAGGRDRTVSYRNLPRSHHLIARHHTGNGTVADGHEEGFLSDGRQVQHAVDRVSQRNLLARQRFALRFQRLYIARHLRRFT